ncbi:MAG: holo-ACP synthase [Clostridia bacterium]|nr:holo-ACP synthase [Clostridia bacterium]
MQTNIGVDLTSIDRIEKAMQNPTFIKRVFSSEEQEYLKNKSYSSAAGIFAAKEAFFKSVGTGIKLDLLREISILHKKSGAPYIKLSNKALQDFKNMKFSVSISHEKNMAVACVIAWED